MQDYLENAANNRIAIAEIKRQLITGEINREEAKELAVPILEKINFQAVQIARKHGKRPHKISFSEAMRNSY